MREKGSILLLGVFVLAMLIVPAWHVTHGAQENCAHACATGCEAEEEPRSGDAHDASTCQICRLATLPVAVFFARVLPVEAALSVCDLLPLFAPAPFRGVLLLDGPPRAPPTLHV